MTLKELENVAASLSFDTPDCHVSGGCDLYITKAASRDKKLYKDIENTLESQHFALVRLSKSLSPPHRELLNLHISNSSPFGPMSQNSSRRTFAYLIATMNASHPDYDFSDITKPSDFVQEPNLASVMQRIDETMYNLRPRTKSQLLSSFARDASGTVSTPGGSPKFCMRSWKVIDKEMTLKECEIYQYLPEDDPFDGEDSAIWSHHFFFFNKRRKRVLYLYVRGFSILSHSPSHVTTNVARSKRPRPTSSQSYHATPGASKRAKYWLGDRADDVEDGWKHYDDSDDYIEDPGDDEVDSDDAVSDEGSPGAVEEADDEIKVGPRSKRAVRGISEDITESMDP